VAGFAACSPKASTNASRGSDGSWLVYPRVLFLTTGSDGLGTLPSGANICLEVMDGLGAFTEVADKSVLLNRVRLDSTRIIVAPTIAGYHDADRVFSLSFLDSASMVNLREWVEAGGILIAGENVGRNTIDGEDRVASSNIMDEREWPLAAVFGYPMQEANLRGYRLVRDSGSALLEAYRPDLTQPLTNAWLLVPVESAMAGSVEVQAWWTDGRTSYPGVTLHPCGRGYGIMVSHFLLLQPSVDGGAGDIAAITEFYRRVFSLAFPGGPEVYVNPWPGAHRSALAVTVNEAGADSAGLGIEPMLGRLLGVPGSGDIDVFVTGRVPGPTLDYLRQEPRVRLASFSFSHRYFRDLDYCRSVWEIASLEDYLRDPLEGFRFPFSNRSAAGMFTLALRGYRYESSVFVDHATGFAGALFPYNLPIWTKGQYCLTTGLLELSPTIEDWDYYGGGALAKEYPAAAQTRDAQRLAARLNSVWQGLVRDRRGMMILVLHARYSGYSEATLEPVRQFVGAAAKSGDAWVSSLAGIADWWSARRNVDIRMRCGGSRTVLSLKNRNPEPVRAFTICLAEPDLKVAARGLSLERVDRAESDGAFTYLTFDLATTGEIEVSR
jgi:peptidoglycan/xylan/chitin deacetylase (PgdA/CDA1 family)